MDNHDKTRPLSDSTARSGVRAAVEFDQVTVRIEGMTILDRVTASVPANGCTAIVGPNGAGKTTLLLALLGQVSYTGKIRFHGVSPDEKVRIGYVPQRLSFDRGMPITVMEFLIMGLQRLPLWLGIRPAKRKRALEHLRSVRGELLADRYLGALSGGEMQRVLLALALQQDPNLLVLDEAASGVDYQGEQIFCELLESLRESRRFTQLMVSHDLAMVMAHSTHVIFLKGGVTGEGCPHEVMNQETLSATFGPHLGIVDPGVLTDPGWLNCPCRKE